MELLYFKKTNNVNCSFFNKISNLSLKKNKCKLRFNLKLHITTWHVPEAAPVDGPTRQVKSNSLDVIFGKAPSRITNENCAEVSSIFNVI